MKLFNKLVGVDHVGAQLIRIGVPTRSTLTQKFPINWYELIMWAHKVVVIDGHTRSTHTGIP